MNLRVIAVESFVLGTILSERLGISVFEKNPGQAITSGHYVPSCSCGMTGDPVFELTMAKSQANVGHTVYLSLQIVFPERLSE